nr:unnamed protein product [Callosobruchus analis]
MSAAGGPAC